MPSYLSLVASRCGEEHLRLLSFPFGSAKVLVGVYPCCFEHWCLCSSFWDMERSSWWKFYIVGV